MGRMTLANFESELELIFGSRSIGNTRIDRWLHWAVDEISGAIDFEALQELQSISTVASTVSYSLDSNCLGIKSVFDTTSDKRLLRVGTEKFMTFDEDTEGNPKFYTRYGGKVHLWPTPDAVYTVKVLKRIEHSSWTSGANDLPAQWDPVVLALAAHYGFGALEELQQSSFWFNRAMALIRSRREDIELDDGEAMPVQVVTSYEELMDRHDSDFSED